ncbi:hypothetical protein BDR07DRAFT_1485519 [Suillus spraguei]|nr:hypothetical protein BDR07DRAFT_1485519 [Suillus spraguei]
MRSYTDLWRLTPLRREQPLNSRELLSFSSSNNIPVFPIRHNGPGGILPEAMLQDLSLYITKDGDYPVARGGFEEIWKCIYRMDRRSVKVAVKALQVYAADQLGAAKTEKIKRIKRELRICAKIQHLDILPVYGYMYGFGPFIAIVSPWAENGNLSEYLEREGVALTRIRRFRIGCHSWSTPSVIHGDFTGPYVLIHGDGTALPGLPRSEEHAIDDSRAACTRVGGWISDSSERAE